MRFLNIEEKELLATLFDNPEATKAFARFLDGCVAGRERAVLTFNLSPENFNELALTKARAEGARLLASDITQALAALKTESIKTSK